MKQQILDCIIARCGYVTFAELSNCIEGFAGDYAWGDSESNMYFWFGLSNEAIDAILELWADHKIKVQITEPLVYMVDGRIPSAPLAKRNRKYAKPHWVPIVFNLPSQDGMFNEHITAEWAERVPA